MSNTIEQALQQPLFLNIQALGDELLNGESLDLDCALALGLRCSNLSQAFALAYRCALQTLVPTLDKSSWAAMCVTEAQGNHPKQLQAYLDETQKVFGHKSFVTMAGLAKQLIVIVKQGEQDGRPCLKAVNISTADPHVEVSVMPAMKMLQEVSHGQVHFNGAAGALLQGDGHELYSKPFRTLEDAHILVACSAMLLGQALRHQMKSGVVQKALSVMAVVKDLMQQEEPWQHLQLAEGFSLFSLLCELFDQELLFCTPEFAQQWQADKALFSIAAKARAARTEKAVQALKSIKV